MREPELVLAIAALLAGACQAPTDASLDPAPEPGATPGTRTPAADAGATSATTSTAPAYEPDLTVSHPPFDEVHVDWKHRLDQPYVYIEHRGSYLETGRLLPVVHRALENQGLRAAGPPFALFYDDPGSTPVDELRSRACVPVERVVQPAEPLLYDLLPSTTVVYAVASGAYPEVPRCYPALYSFMRRLRWVEDGPVREIYLVPPGSVGDWSELRCEVQVPVAYGNS